MSTKIHLQKATRIEGNADIYVEIENSQVKTARFMVQDFRGFEKLIQGKSLEATPHIVARICGLCCTTHEVASLRAIEDALDIQVSPSVSKLRTIAVLGEWIASHALSYFFLTLPDAFKSTNGIFDLIREDPDVARDAFFLRRSGNRIVELVAKRAVHPVALGIGRFLAPLAPADLDEIRDLATQVKETSGRLITQLGSQPAREKRLPFPAAHRVNFLAYDSRPGQEMFRVFNQSGETVQEFSRETFADHIAEMRVDWSLAKFPYLASRGFPEGILLVGPLSRLFLPGGVLDDPELAAFELTDRLRQPAALSLDDLDTCRLLEIFWAARQVLLHLDEVDLAHMDSGALDLAQSGKGIGVVEAPRGVLVHSYLVKQGLMERMNLLVATQFNNAYINLVLQDQAERHAQEDDLSEEGKELIARCVRTFDPCLTLCDSLNRLSGILFIIISAAAFGSLAIFGRFAYAAGLDTATLLFLRFSLAALCMAVLLIVRREGLPPRRALLWLIGMGAIGYVGQSFCYLTAIQYASAGLVALLLYLYPAFVAILAVLFLKAHLTPLKMIALALATLGAALTANPQGGGWTGVLLAIGAAAIYAVYIIVGAGVMQQVSAIQSSTIIFASAGLVYGMLAAIQGPHWPTTPAGWASVAGIVLFATLIPVSAFLAGLKRIGPTDASLLSTLEPVVTVLLAALLLGESLPLLSLAGGALILAAVMLLVRGEGRRTTDDGRP